MNRWSVGAALIISVLYLVAGSTLSAQNVRSKLKIADSTVVQRISLSDGSVLSGRIVEIGETEIKFEGGLGLVTIPIAKIVDVMEWEAKSGSGHADWFPNPNTTRLFMTPTARMLKPGDGYFQNIYLFFVGGAVGITPNIAMGGGISIFPGADEQLYYVAPKFGAKIRKDLHVAVGTLLMGGTGAGGDLVGMAYGVATYGHSDASLTAGLGFAYSGNEVANKPVLLLGGEYRLTKRVGFVTENWIIAGANHHMISFGARFMGEGLAVDLALLRIVGPDIGDQGLGIPYVDFVVNF